MSGLKAMPSGRDWAVGLAILLALRATDADATTRRVPSQYPSIQAGIDAAVPGDTVLVAPGTYTGPSQVTPLGPTFLVMKSGIHLQSETGRDATILDGEGIRRVILCDDVDASTSIVGFTISRGQAYGDWPKGMGGGIYCSESSPTVESCLFAENTADQEGGAMLCWPDSDPVIRDCTFVHNRSQLKRGGGIAIYTSSPIVADCIFVENVAADGGAVSCGQGFATISGSLFTGNSARSGGAILCYDSGPAAISACIFVQNLAENGGAGIQCYYSAPTVSACTFVGNSADHGSGMSCVYWSSPAVTRTLFALGTAGEAIYCDASMGPADPILTCCDVYGNPGGDWVGCIADQVGQNGNFSADPLFCDAESGDLHLAVSSPCAPEHQPECGLIGALGVACSPTAVQPSTWGTVKELFRR